LVAAKAKYHDDGYISFKFNKEEKVNRLEEKDIILAIEKDIFTYMMFSTLKQYSNRLIQTASLLVKPLIYYNISNSTLADKEIY